MAFPPMFLCSLLLYFGIARAQQWFDVPSSGSVLEMGDSYGIVFSSAWRLPSTPSSNCCPQISLCSSSNVCTVVTKSPQSCSPSSSTLPEGWFRMSGTSPSPRCNNQFLLTVPFVTPGAYYLRTVFSTSQATITSSMFSIVYPALTVLEPRAGSGLLDPLACGCSAAFFFRPPALPPPPPTPTPTPTYRPSIDTYQCKVGAATGAAPLTLACGRGAVISAIIYSEYGTFTGGCIDNGDSAPAKGLCSSPLSGRLATPCLGLGACNITNPAAVVGDPCPSNPNKRLIVYYTCALPPRPPPPAVRNQIDVDGALFFSGENASITWGTSLNPLNDGLRRVRLELRDGVSKALLTPLGEGGVFTGADTSLPLMAQTAYTAGATIPLNTPPAPSQTCIIRVTSANYPGLSADSPPFPCYPPLTVSCTLTPPAPGVTPFNPTVFSGTSLGLSWSYGGVSSRGAGGVGLIPSSVSIPSSIMGRPTITISLGLSPVNSPTPLLFLPVTMVASPDDFGSARMAMGNKLVSYSSLAWAVPSSSFLQSRCLALLSTNASIPQSARATWQRSGASVSIESAVAAACALVGRGGGGGDGSSGSPSSFSFWSLSVAPERRPWISGNCPLFAYGGDMFSVSYPSAPLSAGATLFFNWTTILTSPVKVTVGTSPTCLFNTTTTPGASPTASFSFRLPSQRPACVPCDATGASLTPMFATIASVAIPSLSREIPLSVSFPPTLSVALTGPGAKFFVPGSRWSARFTACGGGMGSYNLSLVCKTGYSGGPSPPVVLASGARIPSSGVIDIVVPTPMGFPPCYGYTLTLWNGGVEVTHPTPIAAIPPTPSSTPSNTPTSSNTPTGTRSGTPSGTPSRTASPTSSPTKSGTPTSSRTPSTTPTASLSSSPTASPTGSPTPSTTRTPSTTPSPLPLVFFEEPPTPPSGGGASTRLPSCPTDWIPGGEGSTRCYRPFPFPLTWASARDACKTLLPSSSSDLAAFTLPVEYATLLDQSQALGGDVWLGLYDSDNGTTAAGRACHIQRTCKNWVWATGASNTFLTGTSEGRDSWATYTDNGRCTGNVNDCEPNNLPESQGEYAAGFIYGLALNDWNASRTFPYICEATAGAYAPGVGSVRASWSGGWGVRFVSVNETLASAVKEGRGVGSRGSLLLGGGTLSAPLPRIASPLVTYEYYLPCSLPPGQYSFSVTDWGSSSGTMSSPFSLAGPTLLPLFPTPSRPTVTSLVHNHTLSLAWDASDRLLPVATSEFSTLVFSLVCEETVGRREVPIASGRISAAGGTATLTATAIPGCGGQLNGFGKQYSVRGYFKGCAADYTKALRFGPFSIAEPPEALVVLSPAGEGGGVTWWPRRSSSIFVRFSLTYLRPTTTSIEVSAQATSGGIKYILTSLTPAQGLAGVFSLSYDSLGSWESATAPGFTGPFTLTFRTFSGASSGGAVGVSAAITMASPSAVGVRIVGVAEGGAAYSDTPLTVAWNSTSSCPSSLTLLRRGSPIATATPPGHSLNMGVYLWALPPGAYTEGGAGAIWSVRVGCVGDTATAAFSTSYGFSLSSALVVYTPGDLPTPATAGTVLWPETSSLTLAWSARPGLSDVCTMRIAAVWGEGGAPPYTLVSGLAPDRTGQWTWTPSSADYAALLALSLNSSPWIPLSLVIETMGASSSSSSSQTHISQRLTLPLPPNTFPSSTSAFLPGAYFLLLPQPPTLTVLSPGGNDTLVIGRPFFPTVSLTVPLKGPGSAPVPIPTSYIAPAVQLSFALDLYYAGAFVTALPTWDFDPSYASGTAPPGITLTNFSLGCGTERAYTLVPRTLPESWVTIPPLALPQQQALSPFIVPSPFFGITVPTPTPTITSPLPPLSSSGLLYFESNYTLTWVYPPSAGPTLQCGSGLMLDVALIKSPMPPSTGQPAASPITLRGGPTVAGEILALGVKAVGSLGSLGGSSNFSLLSGESRPWWMGADDPSSFWITLVTPDALRTVVSTSGPFQLTRSAVSMVSSGSASSAEQAVATLTYGAPFTLSIAASGFVGVPNLSFRAFLSPEPSFYGAKVNLSNYIQDWGDAKSPRGWYSPDSDGVLGYGRWVSSPSPGGGVQRYWSCAILKNSPAIDIQDEYNEHSPAGLYTQPPLDALTPEARSGPSTSNTLAVDNFFPGIPAEGKWWVWSTLAPKQPFITLNATIPASPIGTNTPRSPSEVFPLTFHYVPTRERPTVPNPTQLLSPLASHGSQSLILRVQEVTTGMVSSGRALVSSRAALASMDKAYTSWAAAAVLGGGRGGNPPPNPALLRLPGYGALRVTVEMPTLTLAIAGATVESGPLRMRGGDTIPLNLTLRHTWLTGTQGTVEVQLVPPPSPTSPPFIVLPGCSFTFPHLSSPFPATDLRTCNGRLPDTLPPGASWGSGWRVRVVEVGSGAFALAVNPLTLFRGSLVWVGGAPKGPDGVVNLPLYASLGPFDVCLVGGQGAVLPSEVTTRPLSMTLVLGRQFTASLTPSLPPVQKASDAAVTAAGCMGNWVWSVSLNGNEAPPALKGSLPVGAFMSFVLSLNKDLSTPWSIFDADPLTLNNVTVADPGRIILTSADPLGTTYSVRDLMRRANPLSVTVTLPSALHTALSSDRSSSVSVQMRCPGYAKSGWGWYLNDPAVPGSMAAWHWGGDRENYPTLWDHWWWWSPWWYRPSLYDARCAIGRQNASSACAMVNASGVGVAVTDGIAGQGGIPVAMLQAEQVVATVGTVTNLGTSFKTDGAGSGTVSASVPLSGLTGGWWGGSGLTDGACYLSTATRSATVLKPSPGAPSGFSWCPEGTGRACVEIVEGERGRAPGLFFNPLLSFPASDAPFPVSVAFPSKAKYLMNGDSASILFDLSGLSSAVTSGVFDARVFPTSVIVELRAKGFRGDAKVDQAMAGITVSAPTSTGPFIFSTSWTFNISSWNTRDGQLTYTNWGETLREETNFYFRVRSESLATTWVYGDSPPFIYCEVPSMLSLVMYRTANAFLGGTAFYAGDGVGGTTVSDSNVWDLARGGGGTVYDPDRAFVAWQPLLASTGDNTTVLLKQYLVGDVVKARAFGCKCMSGVLFYLELYNYATRTSSPIPDPSAQGASLPPLCGGMVNISKAFDPYADCEFTIPAAAGMFPGGTPLVVRAVSADGRGQEMFTQFFTVAAPAAILTMEAEVSLEVINGGGEQGEAILSPFPTPSSTPSMTPIAPSTSSSPSLTPSMSPTPSVTLAPPSASSTPTLGATPSPTRTPSTTPFAPATPPFVLPLINQWAPLALSGGGSTLCFINPSGCLSCPLYQCGGARSPPLTSSPFVSILGAPGAGGCHLFSQRDDGTVGGWGGDGSGRVSGLSTGPWAQGGVALGETCTLALSPNGLDIMTAGNCSTAFPAAAAAPPSPASSWVSLFVVSTISTSTLPYPCALDNLGKVTCWGGDATSPSAMLGGSGAPSSGVFVGGGGSWCSLSLDGSVTCGGPTAFSPSLQPATTKLRMVALTQGTPTPGACGITASWGVVCWGSAPSPPSSLQATPPVAFLTSSGSSFCAVRSLGDVVCWGGGGDSTLPAIASDIKVRLPASLSSYNAAIGAQMQPYGQCVSPSSTPSPSSSPSPTPSPPPSRSPSSSPAPVQPPLLPPLLSVTHMSQTLGAASSWVAGQALPLLGLTLAPPTQLHPLSFPALLLCDLWKGDHFVARLGNVSATGPSRPLNFTALLPPSLSTAALESGYFIRVTAAMDPGVTAMFPPGGNATVQSPASAAAASAGTPFGSFSPLSVSVLQAGLPFTLRWTVARELLPSFTGSPSPTCSFELGGYLNSTGASTPQWTTSYVLSAAIRISEPPALLTVSLPNTTTTLSSLVVGSRYFARCVCPGGASFLTQRDLVYLPPFSAAAAGASPFSVQAPGSCPLGVPCSLTWSGGVGAFGGDTPVDIALVWGSGTYRIASFVPLARASFTFSLPSYPPPSLASALNAPLWITVSLSNNPGVYGASSVFTLTPAPPPSPPLTILSPTFKDTWRVLVDASAGNAASITRRGPFLVSWSTGGGLGGALLLNSTISVLLEYRAGSSGMEGFKPATLASLPLATGVPVTNYSRLVTVPDSVPLALQTSASSAPFLYRITLVSEQNASMKVQGDFFSLIKVTSSSIALGIDAVYMDTGFRPAKDFTLFPSTIFPNTATSALDAMARSLSLSSSQYLTLPGLNYEGSTAQLLSSSSSSSSSQVGLTVVQPMAGALFSPSSSPFGAPLASNLTVSWYFNASTSVVTEGITRQWPVSLFLVRRLPSGDILPVTTLVTGLKRVTSWTWSLTPASLTGLHLGEGYSVLVLAELSNSSTLSTLSGSFTLASRPTLSLTHASSPPRGTWGPSSAYTEGDAVRVTWTALDFTPSAGEALKLEFLRADTGALLSPPLSDSTPLARGNFSWGASLAWGSSPLLLRATSLSNPSVWATAQGAPFRFIPTPRLIRVNSSRNMDMEGRGLTFLSFSAGSAPPKIELSWQVSGLSAAELGTVTLNCASNPAIVVSTSPVPLSLGKFLWNPPAFPQGLSFPSTGVTTLTCSLTVASFSDPLLFHASSRFVIADASVPYVALLPPPSTAALPLLSLSLNALPGERLSLPLYYSTLAISAAASPTFSLVATHAITGVTTALASEFSQDAALPSQGSLSFTLPTSLPQGTYCLAVTPSGASADRVKSACIYLSLAPATFLFSQPTQGARVLPGGTLPVAWDSPELCKGPATALRSLSDISVDLVSVDVGGAGPSAPLFSNLFSDFPLCLAPGDTPLVSIPSNLSYGVYAFLATSASVASLRSLSPSFFVAPPQPGAGSTPPLVLSNVFLAGLPDFVTTGQTLAVLYNATAFSPRADFTFMLYGCQRSLAMPRDPQALVKTLASCNLTLPIGTGRNVGVFRWAVPTRIFARDGPTPWDESLAYYVGLLWDSGGGSGSATSTSTSTSTASSSSSVLVGLASKALTLINPSASAISTVSLYPDPSDPGGALRGVLDASTQTSLGVTWTRVGDAGTTYSIELWQERFYYSGGDALLTNVSVVGGAVSTSAAGGGAGGPGASMTYTWGPIPTTLSSIEPVYMLVRVLSGPFLGSWGRSRVFRLRSAPLPGLGAFLATACRPRAGGGGAGAPATTLLNPAIPPALCARNCSSCEAAGGLWSAGGLVNLTFSANTTGSTVPLTSSEIQRIGATWGAFSQVSSVCLPKTSTYTTSMRGGPASATPPVVLTLGDWGAWAQPPLSALRPSGLSLGTLVFSPILTVTPATGSVSGCSAIPSLLLASFSIVNASLCDLPKLMDISGALTTALGSTTNEGSARVRVFQSSFSWSRTSVTSFSSSSSSSSSSTSFSSSSSFSSTSTSFSSSTSTSFSYSGLLPGVAPTDLGSSALCAARQSSSVTITTTTGGRGLQQQGSSAADGGGAAGEGENSPPPTLTLTFDAFVAAGSDAAAGNMRGIIEAGNVSTLALPSGLSLALTSTTVLSPASLASVAPPDARVTSPPLDNYVEVRPYTSTNSSVLASTAYSDPSVNSFLRDLENVWKGIKWVFSTVSRFLSALLSYLYNNPLTVGAIVGISIACAVIWLCCPARFCPQRCAQRRKQHREKVIAMLRGKGGAGAMAASKGKEVEEEEGVDAEGEEKASKPTFTPIFITLAIKAQSCLRRQVKKQLSRRALSSRSFHVESVLAMSPTGDGAEADRGADMGALAVPPQPLGVYTNFRPACPVTTTTWERLAGEDGDSWWYCSTLDESIWELPAGAVTACGWLHFQSEGLWRHYPSGRTSPSPPPLDEAQANALVGAGPGLFAPIPPNFPWTRESDPQESWWVQQSTQEAAWTLTDGAITTCGWAHFEPEGLWRHWPSGVTSDTPPQ